MNTLISRIVIFSLILVGWQSILSANSLFENDEILNVVLTAPISQAYQQKKLTHRLWHTGQWAFTDTDSTTKRLDVSIRTRGVNRRKNCKLPPLRLNFKKKQVEGTLFQGQDKIKLVAPCKANDSAEQQLILEFLAYRSLAILTEKSMRTRLLRLSYVDSDNKKTWTHYAFLLETESEIARRLGLEVRHVPKVYSRQHNKPHTALIELFQLLIANNDYSVIVGPNGSDCCHNIEVLAPPVGDEDLIMIPYDFDSSGLVDASYAIPSEKIPIKSVRTRYFRGRCQTDEILNAGIAQVLSKKTEILDLFQGNELLNARNKSKTIKYINDYFKIIEDPKGIEKKIKRKCRGKV